MIATTLFFALMNTGVKFIPYIPASEIVMFRALVTLIVVYILIRREGLNPWGNNKRLLIMRGLTGTVALLTYFYILQNMPLASAVTILNLSPIFTIIIAGIMLREPARPIQWLFFFVSFIGVLMIKGFDHRVSGFDLIIGITAAAFSGLAYNFIRKLKDYDHPLIVVFYFPMVTIPIVSIYAIPRWVMPNFVEFLILIGIGISTTAAQYCMTKAYHLERASNISNFNYLGIIYALFIGFFIFNESIGILGILGIALIVFGVIMGSRYGQVSDR
ncbi:MAG: DMT family transporter [candidate division Zixibacteria bacterium]|nr:DMT family transporter [candidate division Zixibacteria bacterium]